MTKKRKLPSASIIIPAFNEEAVIGETLVNILSEAEAGEFEIIVICNGCSDDTANIVREFEDRVRVVEIPLPSKTNALNFGNQLATAYPRVMLDADVRIAADTLRKLVYSLNSSGKLLAAGSMQVELDDCDVWVRSFHRVWRFQPYFDQGKVGGIYALSREGVDRIKYFPALTADDEFVRRSFSLSECLFLEDCKFFVKAPLTFASLVKVKTRVRRGNLELKSRFPMSFQSSSRSRTLFLKRILLRPSVWSSAFIYGLITVLADIGARRDFAKKEKTWARDLTTRASTTIQPETEA